ncbi:Imm1 family immunity protein [Saccharopolyspora shandongensis]
MPRSMVEEALAEFLRTGQGPRAVQWEADPDPLMGWEG